MADKEPTLAELDAMPTVNIVPQPETDVIGRKLPSDPDRARAQAREAVAIRRDRVTEDVKRVERGLKPLHATE